jgi:hypothetical protein
MNKSELRRFPYQAYTTYHPNVFFLFFSLS